MDKDINLDDFVKYLENGYDPYHICSYDVDEECDQWDPPEGGRGRIIVKSVLCCEDGEPLEDVAIELYLISNCKAPGFKLIDCKYTDKDGKVIFRCLEVGECYAIREIVPHNCLIPKYYSDFTIELTNSDPEGCITVINLPPRRCNNDKCSC
ncbi:MAG: prealbumin-like fold domain-containing protein [Clostridium perfringens]|nr:prealbumin-like fold domain-containing protein [Clostridium perfringens]